MATVTLGQAARLTGRGKTTLARAIRAGRLPATRTDQGGYRIDTAELARVYPAPREAAFAATRPSTPPATQNALAAILAAEVAILRRQLDDLREDRDRWRALAERLAGRPD